MTREEQARKLLAALHATENGLAARGARQVVDELMERPLRSFVGSVDEVERLVLAAWTSENVARVAARQVRPGLERYRAGFAATGETPGAWMDDALRGRLASIVASAKPPRMRWARKAVDPALVRRLFAPVVQDTLIGFAKRLPLPGTGGGGAGGSTSAGSARLSSAASGLLGIGRSLKAQVEKRAEPLLETGKSLLGGVGAEFEARIQTAARDFSEGALSGIRDAVRDRLASDEGREIEREIRQQVLATILDTPISELLDDVDRMPLDAIDAWVADWAELAAKGERLPPIVRREIEALLASEGDRTLGELLEESGVRAQAVDLLVARVEAQLAENEPTDGMVAWVVEWLEAAGV
jgi:hypothetical protein